MAMLCRKKNPKTQEVGPTHPLGLGTTGQPSARTSSWVSPLHSRASPYKDQGYLSGPFQEELDSILGVGSASRKGESQPLAKVDLAKVLCLFQCQVLGESFVLLPCPFPLILRPDSCLSLSSNIILGSATGQGQLTSPFYPETLLSSSKIGCHSHTCFPLCVFGGA